MGKAKVTITISTKVWRKLQELKKELEASSYDEVLRILIEHYERTKGFSIWTNLF